MTSGPAVSAIEFESREVYRSRHYPKYACWVSVFPGERGQWYLAFQELKCPENRLPRITREQWFLFGLPVGYDKWQYLIEEVVLESNDNMKTWKEISREQGHFQHTSGSFGQARTRDGRFLRFVWTCFSFEENAHPGEILYISSDDGKTWKKQPEFHDRRFYSYPHRLRALRDGTLVLAVPLSMAWGPGTDRPLRTCSNLNVHAEIQMNLCFSHDQGRTWTPPLPIYGGQQVSETDFVELPSGDLLCINNSVFGYAGRQMIYRTEHGFAPGPFERVMSMAKIEGKEATYQVVPETVCFTEDGILVGCMRNSLYAWSDDLGLTWQALEGIPDHITNGRETYQPWIHCLGDGRIACAGHYGGDCAVGELDQYLMIHFFRLDVRRKTKNTRIDLVRDFDEATNRCRNAYTLTLTCDGTPLADKEIEFWYVERDRPGYGTSYKHTLDERMRSGGELIRLRTDADGVAHVAVPHLDKIEYIHHCIQLVARFNVDRSDPDYKPAQTPQFEQYSVCYQDPPL